MQILCCYDNNKLDLKALESFKLYAPGVKMVNCTGNWASREALAETRNQYWTELRSLWRGDEDIVVLKQRFPITPDALVDMLDCDAMVCRKDGHTRYSAELQQKLSPKVIGGDYIVWHMLDERLNMVWAIHQIEICLHYNPPVRQKLDARELMDQAMRDLEQ